VPLNKTIIYRDSAFKHEFTEKDILHAVETAIYDAPIENYEDKILLIGFDTHLNPIEVIYNEFGENGMNIFHVNKAQRKNIDLLEANI
jgi:hypothetical protein